MLTGSYVSSFYGEPRTTHDIDVIVQLRKQDAPRILEMFPEPEYYLDPDAVLDAIRREGMVNAMHVESGDKVDFWVLKPHPYDQERFGRRVRAKIAGVEADVSTPEDTIIQKLRWTAESGWSLKQFTDALRVYELQAAILDRAYIEMWIRELGLQELWLRLLREAKPL